MAKYVRIKNDFSYHYVLIGIASDERIWKVCHEINNLLSLKLKNTDQPSLPLTPFLASQPKPSEEEMSLFDDHTPNFRKEPFYYEDYSTETGFYYSFFETNPMISLKKVRPFRYFLLIRAEERSILRIGNMLRILKTSTSIRSAVDISDATNINEIIH